MFWVKVIINKITNYKCLWSPASPFFILWQACQQERCRKDRQAWMKVLISLHCVRTFVAEQGQWKPNEIYMKTLWKLVKESKVVWWCLMWFAFNWEPIANANLRFMNRPPYLDIRDCKTLHRDWSAIGMRLMQSSIVYMGENHSLYNCCSYLVVCCSLACWVFMPIEES